MRNLLGRLHARRLAELLRIAAAWDIPLPVEGKGEVVSALYRALTDPRVVRDIWDRLDAGQRAVVLTLADAPEPAATPTLAQLAANLSVSEAEARETVLGLYALGILAREGDDEPLAVGEAPRLMLPRELALQFRRIQDEMAAGDLARAPLRALIALLDDAELEGVARLWGLRVLPGMATRQELSRRLLQLVSDPSRIERVARGRGRDAAAIWRTVRATTGPAALNDVASAVGLAGHDPATIDRLRAALAELEGALLVWHAYRRDGSRWLFIPEEIRSPGALIARPLPPLQPVEIDATEAIPWQHPDALAWDLLTLLRIVSDPAAPLWNPAQPPRWLVRAAAPRCWIRARDGLPTGYLELLQTLAEAEGALAIDEDAHPRRVIVGPRVRAWRRLPFSTQTARLRERWLRLGRWIEGEPAGLVDAWGADWRGMRARLLTALGDPDIGLHPASWVTLESLSGRIATRFPALLGSSFTAATARLGGEVGAGVDADEARRAALSDIVGFELSGPFAWFGLTAVADVAGRPRAVRVTQVGAALAARQPLPTDGAIDAAQAPLVVAPSGEITLRAPSPDRVWALSAFSELVDLGPETHYRLTSESVAAALAAGIEPVRITGFLERASGQPLPPALAARIAAWTSRHRRVHLRRAVILRLDEPSGRAAMLEALQDDGWTAEALRDDTILVEIDPSQAMRDEDALLTALQTAGHMPQWVVEGDAGIAGDAGTAGDAGATGDTGVAPTGVL